MRDPFQLAIETSRIQASSAYGPPSQGVGGKETSYYPRPNWLDMGAAGQAFYYNNQIYPAAPASVFLPAVGAEVTVCSFTVPVGKSAQIFVIIAQVVTGGFIDGSGSVLFRVEINGVCPQGLSAIGVTLNGQPGRGDFSKHPIRAKETDKVALICANISLVTAPNVNPLIGIFDGKYEPLAQQEQNQWI